MDLLRSIGKIFSGQPFLLQMRVVSEKVRITIRRGDQIVSHNDIVKHKSLPPALKQFLNTYANSNNGYFVTLPVARRLSLELQAYSSDFLLLETDEVDQLEVTSCPLDFKVHWQFDHSRQILTRRLVDADGYLGDGWFFKGNESWQPSMSLTDEMIRWLDQPEIESQSLFLFVERAISLFGSPTYHCDLTISSNFQAQLEILKALKQSLEVRITSNNPDLQKQIEIIRGDEANLISGTKILPGWRKKLRGKLLKLAKSGQPVKFDGQNLLALIQDDITPVAAHLKVNLNSLGAAYPIDDAARLPLKWTLAYKVVAGIGRYYAVPSLQAGAALISIPKLRRQVQNKIRFLQAGDRWLELTPNFKAQLAEWQRNNVSPIHLTSQEVLGVASERLRALSLQAPKIEVPQGDSEIKQVMLHIDTLRQHGLPVGLYGLKKDIPRILAVTCQQLLQENKQARILWITIRRKTRDVKSALDEINLRSTIQLSDLRSHNIFLATPDSMSGIAASRMHWTLVIFDDIDDLVVGQSTSQAYTFLSRDWSIATFSRRDWHENVVHRGRYMGALELPPDALSRFAAICYKELSDQSESLLQRLSAPFRRMVIKDDDIPNEKTTSDIPIPSRPVENEHSTSRKLETVYRPTFEISIEVNTEQYDALSPENFVAQARKFVDKVEAETEAVPFMQYWPTYSAMTAAQKKWYFYWRSQVRLGNYLPADKSYLFVYIYEVLNLIGFDTPQAAFEQLVKFWKNYRVLYRLDSYLVSWIADFLIVHKLSKSPFEWYTDVLKEGGYPSEKDLAIEAWFSLGEDLKYIPIELLRMLSDYNPKQSKFYQQHNKDGVIDKAFGHALESIDLYMKQTSGKGFIQTFRPEKQYLIQRRPYSSALVIGRKSEITIGTVPHWSDSTSLRSSVIAILKYTENLLRRQQNFRGTLRGIELPSEWAKVLDAAFPSSDLQTKAPKRRDTITTEQREKASTSPVEPLIIDYSKVNTLTTVSNEIRDRLIVDDHFTEIETPTDGQVATNTTISAPKDFDSKLELNIEPPESASAHLLTDLVSLHEVIIGDQVGIQLLNELKLNKWEMEAGAVNNLTGGLFLSVIVDGINERALEHLGDQLIVIEDERLIVTEDYRDELEHLLTQSASTADVKQSYATELLLSHEIAPEWIEFAGRMQPHYWQVINTLLLQENVDVHLSSIARSVYKTPDLLIDEINELSLASIGDLIIEPGELPSIQAENLENLRSLMARTQKNVIREA